MKKLFVLSVLLIGLLKICYAQNYIFMTRIPVDIPLEPEIMYSCEIDSAGAISNCQPAYHFGSAVLSSAPVVVNQHLIFSYEIGLEQIFQNCPILANGLLGDCTQSSMPNDSQSYYGFIVGYQQPSEGAIDKLELSDTEPKNIEIA